MEPVVAGYGLPDPDQNGSRSQLFIRFNMQAPIKQIHCDAIITVKTHPESLIGQIDWCAQSCSEHAEMKKHDELFSWLTDVCFASPIYFSI